MERKPLGGLAAKLTSLFSASVKEIGIDLGTANTLVYVRGEGIVLREPSVVAVDLRSNEVLAVGKQAKEMVGRTPDSIVAVRPLKDGVIADFEVTAAMLKYFVRKALQAGAFSRPHMVICMPVGVNEVERRAVEDAAKQVGAGKVELVPEPLAAAMGAGIDVHRPMGSMVVDIGGGTTECAVLACGEMIVSDTLRLAGDRFDEAISAYIRKKHGITVGERTAELIKMRMGSAYPLDTLRNISMEVRGQRAENGQPLNGIITADDVREALLPSLQSIVESICGVLENTPAELCADLMTNGIVVTGGGALLRGIDQYLEQKIGVPVRVAERPMDCVAEGTGLVLEGEGNSFAHVHRE